MTHSRKQISNDGSASNEFLINEEFIAMLDYYVVTSLSAKSSEAQHFRTFHCVWLAMYKALDKKQDRRNWRPALLEVLNGWLRMFPEAASKNKGRLSFGSATHAQPSAVSQDNL